MYETIPIPAIGSDMHEPNFAEERGESRFGLLAILAV